MWGTDIGKKSHGGCLLLQRLHLTATESRSSSPYVPRVSYRPYVSQTHLEEANLLPKVSEVSCSSDLGVIKANICVFIQNSTRGKADWYKQHSCYGWWQCRCSIIRHSLREQVKFCQSLSNNNYSKSYKLFCLMPIQLGAASDPQQCSHSINYKNQYSLYKYISFQLHYSFAEIRLFLNKTAKIS